MVSLLKFSPFPLVPLLDRPEIAYNPGVDFRSGAAFFTFCFFSIDITMLRTDGKGRCQGEIGKAVIFTDCFDKSLDGFRIRSRFTEKDMLDRAAGIFLLEGLLEIQYFEYILTEIDRKLSGIGVDWDFGIGIEREAVDHFRKSFGVQPGQPEPGSFRRCRLEIIKISCLFLVFLESVAHEIENFKTEPAPAVLSDGYPQEIQAGLIGPYDADGGKMVLPVFPESFFHIS
jgi:hypothetical protein